MATLSSDISDLFLSNIYDYKLNTIFTTSGSLAMNTTIEPWIRSAAIEFAPVCTQDLTFVETSGSSEGYFVETLTAENKNVLSQIVTKFWLNKQVNDVVAFKNFIQDHDFTRHSSAQNYLAKQEAYNAKREEISQLINDYAYRHNSWTDWYTQIFDGSV